MKLKYLATAAAAMIAASPAFAVLNGPDAGGAELFLTVWSAPASLGGTGSNTNISYTLDLGVSLLDMVANQNVNNYVNQIVSTDSTFSSFLSALSASSLSGLQFNVAAATRGGLDTPTDVMLSTVAGSTMGSLNNLQLSNSLDQVLGYVGGVNSDGNHSAVANGSSTSTSGDSYFMNNLGNTWGSSAPLNSKAVGTNATFGSYTQSGFGQTPTTASVFAGTFFFGQAAPGVYSVQYQVAAVPEPTGYALALAGLGVIGFVSRRRKS